MLRRGLAFFVLIPVNLDEIVDEIGVVFPYARAEVMAMPMTAILRLYRRAMTHLKIIYSAVRLTA